MISAMLWHVAAVGMATPVGSVRAVMPSRTSPCSKSARPSLLKMQQYAGGYGTQQGYDYGMDNRVVWQLTGLCGVRGFSDVAGFDGSALEQSWERHKAMAADVMAMGGSAASICTFTLSHTAFLLPS